MTDSGKPVPRLWLKAYALGSTEGWSIEPAPARRQWMDETYKKIAYRCLPLVAANQAGWVVRCPANFTATWSGKIDNYGVDVAYAPDSAHLANTALSHFGSGVLTFVLPWLFRTPPGIGLLVRGLANEVKDNAIPLDGIIETDWSPFTFTMSWKIVRSGVPVHFRRGDPVCMIQPIALGLLERFDCSFEPGTALPEELQQGFHDFVQKRSAAAAVAPRGDYETQRDYFMGRYPDGSPASYPSGTTVVPPIGGCPVQHHDIGALSAAPSADEKPTPVHRTTFNLKPFTD